MLDQNKLLKMNQHGFEVFKTQDDENNGFGILHHLVKNKVSSNEANQMISFVSQQGGQMALDHTNRHGETALHLCSGKSPNFEIAKILLLKGASCQVRNAIGDTPLKLAQRCGHMELAMLFQQSTCDDLVLGTPPIAKQKSEPVGERAQTRGSQRSTNSGMRSTK